MIMQYIVTFLLSGHIHGREVWGYLPMCPGKLGLNLPPIQVITLCIHACTGLPNYMHDFIAQCMDALVISSKACVLSNNVRTHYIVIKINFVYTALIAHVST